MSGAQFQNFRALKRPAPPSRIGPAAQVKQRQLDAADPLRGGLSVLQLAKLPGSILELAITVSRLHPDPQRWSTEHAAAYRQVFDAISQASGSSARATGGPGRAPWLR
jgi:hypothetical protein